MAQPDRPLRADAARNRARVLEVAYETFAAEGLSVPIDEIARRAGVGAGTVYRHFPTKEDLYRAVVEDRIGNIVDEGRALLSGRRAGRGAVRLPAIDGAAVGRDRSWLGRGARRGRNRHRDRDARRRRRISSGCWTTCCGPGRAAGTVRSDIGVRDVKSDAGRRQRNAGGQSECGRAADRGLSGRSSRTAVNDLALSLAEC